MFSIEYFIIAVFCKVDELLKQITQMHRVRAILKLPYAQICRILVLLNLALPTYSQIVSVIV